MVCQPRLNNNMARLFFIVFAFCLLSVTSVNADQNSFADEPRYQNMAEDFRNFSVCQSIHQNLAMFIAIHYGIGANMNFPPEWLEQQRGLIQNILSQEVRFGEKLEVVIKNLNEEFGFPVQGLLEQKRLNQSNTTQGIIFSISSAISNPEEASIIIRGMLTESQRCRSYESKFNYEE